VGIDATGNNFRLRNGRVSGFSQWGIATTGFSAGTGFSSISDVDVEQCVNTGIRAGTGTTVSNTKLTFNGVGLATKGSVLATDVVAAFNATGVATGCDNEECAQISSSTIFQNGLGVYDWGGGTRIASSSITSNDGDGINNVNGGSTYENLQISANGGRGVSLGGGTALTTPALPTVIRSSTIINNTSAEVQSGAGPFIDAGSNVCGTSAGCP